MSYHAVTPKQKFLLPSQIVDYLIAGRRQVVSIQSIVVAGKKGVKRNQSLVKEMASLRRSVLKVGQIVKSSVLPNKSSIIAASPIRIETSVRPQSSWLFRFYSEKHSNAQSLDIDLSNEESKRRIVNRLLYRSKQRGFLELDLVLGKWVEENIHSMDENGIKALVHVLDLENPDLWKWLTGQEQPPEAVSRNPVFYAVHDKVMKNLKNHAAPETRAILGEPWVRGWDDFKKGRDSPITGNQ